MTKSHKNSLSKKPMHKHKERATLSSADKSAKFFDKKIEEKWLSTMEAASYLGITPNALRILVCRGKVNYYKLGSRLRFREQDLTTLLLCENATKKTLFACLFLISTSSNIQTLQSALPIAKQPVIRSHRRSCATSC